MSQKITHILFATDLSRNSAHAMVHAANLAQAAGARLHVLHVAEPLSDDARITLQLFLQDKTARRDAIEMRSSHLREILQERQKKFWAALPEDDRGAQELVDSIEIIEGHPAEVILRRAAELNCDLIVLGAHDHGFSRTFLGTVAKRVLRRAEIPTLVVPYIED